MKRTYQVLTAKEVISIKQRLSPIKNLNLDP